MPPNRVSSVKAQLLRSGAGGFWIEYTVGGAAELVLPPRRRPEPADDLWNSTCFELFARSRGSKAYLELNFSPSFQWAAYEFADYRMGRRDLQTHDPEISISDPSNSLDPMDWFFLAVESLPNLGPEPLQFGIAAVVEETDGTKSYWALAHPPGDKPDFHDPACFALELPAAKPA